MSRIEYNPSLNDRVNGQLGDLGVEIQIPLSSIKELIVPPAPVAPYKVYTALVTQNGESDSQTQTSGELTSGRTYSITATDGGTVDFTNVGAPNNNEGTSFIATATANPNSWGENGNGSLSFNTGAPTISLLFENTIGDIWFEYSDTGVYFMRSDNLFTVNKTVSLNDQTRCIDSGNNLYNLKIESQGDPSQVNITVLNDEFENRNGRLTTKPIEIRVYN